MLAADSVSLPLALTLAVSGGVLGSIVGGLVTWRVAHAQISADNTRHWIDVAAGAYAETVAVASGFNAVSAAGFAREQHDTGVPSAEVAAVRSRASAALAELERTSAISDSDAVQTSAEGLSAALREADYTWGQLIAWRLREHGATEYGNTTLQKAAGNEIDRYNHRLDEYLAELYGTKGENGEKGALDTFRDAIRSSR